MSTALTAAIPAFAQIENNEQTQPPAAIAAPANLWQAAMLADRDWIDNYLHSGGDINARDPNHNTALLHAVGKGRCEFVDYLLRRGADVNAVGRMGWTPLISASFYGHSDCVTRLLRAGAKTELFSQDGLNAAFYAVQNQQADVLAELLQHRANINAIARTEFHDRQTLLMFAAQQKDGATLDILLAHKPDTKLKDRQGRTALYYAAMYDRLDHLKKLAAAGANVQALDNDKNSLLHAAARTASWPTIAWLLQQKLDLSQSNNVGATPLQALIVAGNMPVLESLLSTIDKPLQLHALQLAADAALQPAVDLLLRQGVNIDASEADRRTALMRAATRGHILLTQFLLKQHANIALQDSQGNTALHNALLAPTVNFELVKLLIDTGADIDTKNNADQTARVLISQLAADEKHKGENWRALL